MAERTDYAKSQEDKHRRKIILPHDISWEYGSNKYATQKGSAGFGTLRNNTLKISSSKNLSESNDGVVPRHSCPPIHHPCPSQSKTSGFGAIREQVTKVFDTNGDQKILISKIVDDKKTETVLKKWNQPNRKKRDTLTEVTGGRQMGREDNLKCLAAIPRFQDPRGTIAQLNKPSGPSFQPCMHQNRQTTILVEGLDIDQSETNRYMAWLGGQLTLQSQSRTGGFNKTRDVVSQDYYRKIDKTSLNAEELRKKLLDAGGRQDTE